MRDPLFREGVPASSNLLPGKQRPPPTFQASARMCRRGEKEGEERKWRKRWIEATPIEKRSRHTSVEENVACCFIYVIARADALVFRLARPRTRHSPRRGERVSNFWSIPPDRIRRGVESRWCTDRGSQSRAVHSFLLVAKLVTNYSGPRLSLVYLPAFNYRSIVSASFTWIGRSLFIFIYFLSKKWRELLILGIGIARSWNFIAELFDAAQNYRLK